nr:MAG TPA: hypothetical protein [Caudoviricetes sp.]
MNYYKKIAEMLGVELEEEFKLKPSCLEKPWNCLYRFSKDGLENKYSDLSWVKCEKGAIDNILIGQTEVIKIPWKPKKGEAYWHYSKRWEQATFRKWEGTIDDLCTWKCGSCFRTEEEANTKGKEIMEQIQKEFEEA